MNRQIKLDEEKPGILKAFESGQTRSTGIKKISELLAMHLQSSDEFVEARFSKSSDLPDVANLE